MGEERGMQRRSYHDQVLFQERQKKVAKEVMLPLEEALGQQSVYG